MGEIRSGEFPFLASLCGDVVEQATVSATANGGLLSREWGRHVDNATILNVLSAPANVLPTLVEFNQVHRPRLVFFVVFAGATAIQTLDCLYTFGMIVEQRTQVSRPVL